jgi:malate dehydrogenase (oxaloacetate-decarboxylating)
LGLGVLAVEASRISDEMLASASKTLAAMSPRADNPEGELLPPIADTAAISKEIAFSVAKVAQEQDFTAELNDQRLREKIEELFWLPEYRPYKYSAE